LMIYIVFETNVHCGDDGGWTAGHNRWATAAWRLRWEPRAGSEEHVGMVGHHVPSITRRRGISQNMTRRSIPRMIIWCRAPGASMRGYIIRRWNYSSQCLFWPIL
jgi:hypothetical protein